MAKKLIIIQFLTCILLSGFAQTWNYRQYGLEQGLSQSQVMCVHQDNEGFIWLGTNGGGINIFDGKTFSQLDQKKGLLDNTVFCITQNNEGTYFIGTNKGLAVYYNGKFRNYTESDGLPNKRVFNLLVDKDGFVWIGTAKGVAKLVNGKIVKFNDVPCLNNASVFTSLQDKSGNVWFATLGDGLIRYSKKGFKQFTTNDSLANNSVRAIAEDNNGNIIVGTYRGTSFIKNGTNICITLNYTTVGSLLVTKSDLLIIGAHIGTLHARKYNKNFTSVADAKMSEVFNAFKNEKLDKIHCSIEDKEGNIIIGTEAGLVVLPMNKRFFNYSEKDSLINNSIKTIYQSSDGKFWFGTGKDGVLSMTIEKGFKKKFIGKSYGFTTLKMDKFVKQSKTQSKASIGKTTKESKDTRVFDYYISGTSINSITEDSKNNIWIGTTGGVSRVSPDSKIMNFACGLTKYDSINKFVNFIYKPQLPSRIILYIYSDKQDNIWVGTTAGLALAKDTSFTNMNLTWPELKSLEVLYIYQDKSNNIWFCTSKGAYSFDGKKLNTLGKKQGFIDEEINNVVQDQNGNLWFGTRQGIYRYDGKNFKRIDENDGLSTNNIYSIEIDAQNNILVGTSKGIDRINLQNFNAGVLQIEHFGKEDGFIGVECNKNSLFKDKEGRLWFGTVGGVTVYDASLIKKNNVVPSPKIIKFQLKLKDITEEQLKKYSDGIDPKTGLPINLDLPYDENHLTFEFVAPSYSVPEKVKYKYILEGLSAEWTPPRSLNQADFNGLSNGEYTLKILACNEDGIWCTTPTEFKFTINPPIWKTWWFYTILGIIVTISIVVYIRRREKALIRDKMVLERKVKERTAEVVAQKEEIQKQAIELEKLSIVASETDNAVMIMSANGDFEWVNEGFTRMYGYTLEQLVLFRGKNICDSSGNPELKQLIDSGFNTSEPVIYEALTTTKYGDKIWTQTTITPIVKDSRIVKLVAIDSNINKMKLAEEEIKQQKEEIEAQRDEIQEQKHIVDEKNKDITDSINYARNIQHAILPNIDEIHKNFPDSFILFKPRDIVSGDFYWYTESDRYAYFAAVDCTGHGVPGAFMSMLGFAFLNEIVNKESIIEPEQILNKLRAQIIKSLHQQGRITDSKDGMDTVLVVIDKIDFKVHMAAANNPLYLIRNKELIEYKGDKMPIAYYVRMDSFSKQTIDLQKGDTLYFFSDGYADQFGGPKGKKFMYKHLKELLISIQDNTMEEQKHILDFTIEEWKSYVDEETGNYYGQVDDILIIGIRV